VRSICIPCCSPANSVIPWRSSGPATKLVSTRSWPAASSTRIFGPKLTISGTASDAVVGWRTRSADDAR
jgi:hypothetical protein